MCSFMEFSKTLNKNSKGWRILGVESRRCGTVALLLQTIQYYDFVVSSFSYKLCILKMSTDNYWSYWAYKNSLGFFLKISKKNKVTGHSTELQYSQSYLRFKITLWIIIFNMSLPGQNIMIPFTTVNASTRRNRFFSF